MSDEHEGRLPRAGSGTTGQWVLKAEAVVAGGLLLALLVWRSPA
ncbi:hypothetical protein ACFQV4_30475 [Streptomyces thermocarboxydus]